MTGNRISDMLASWFILALSSLKLSSYPSIISFGVFDYNELAATVLGISATNRWIQLSYV